MKIDKTINELYSQLEDKRKECNVLKFDLKELDKKYKDLLKVKNNLDDLIKLCTCEHIKFDGTMYLPDSVKPIDIPKATPVDE